MLYRNFLVEKHEADLKVVGEYTMCFTCLGAMKDQDGHDCPDCSGGWRFDTGKQITELGPVLEVKKFQAPSNPQSKLAYHLITDPA